MPPGEMSVTVDNNVGSNGWLRMLVTVRELTSHLELYALAKQAFTYEYQAA